MRTKRKFILLLMMISIFTFSFADVTEKLEVKNDSRIFWSV